MKTAVSFCALATVLASAVNGSSIHLRVHARSEPQENCAAKQFDANGNVECVNAEERAIGFGD